MKLMPIKAASLLAMSMAAVLVACSPGDSAKDKSDHAGMDHSEMPMDASITVPDYADNFRLIDHTGTSHELHYHTEASAIVLVSHGNGCPIVRGSIPELQAISEAYADKGVKVLLLNSNLQDDRDAVAAEAAEYGMTLPILMDDNQIIGESLGVQRTAQVFVIDPAAGFQIVYSGPLDDRQSYERQKAEAQHTYLRDALDQLVAGDEVTVEAPPLSPGCLVNFPERDKRAEHQNISYSADVAPILLDKCADCHSVGGIGPWAMTDYTAVKGWSPMMREVIRTDRMPPWHADPNVGNFHGDRSLTSEQLKTIVHWIEAGSPRGDGPDPLEIAKVTAEEWPLGEPDLILTLPEFDVPATGIVDYRYPFVENPLTEDKWVRATTVKVGSRETVHHVLSGYMPEAPADGRGDTSKWQSSVGGYAVGAESSIQGEDSGTPFPAGGGVGFQMHYTPTGKAATDVTQIGVYFHDEVPKLMNRSSVVIDFSIEIPPNTAEHKETAYVEFPADAILLSVFPHAHYRGRASNLRIRYPDGEEKMLVSLPRYDFNWQRAYVFEEPVDVPAGSKLIADYIYDNSSANPANPDPTAKVTWGDQSMEEMLFSSFAYRWVGETTDNRMDHLHEQLSSGRTFGAMDDNIDGELQLSEIRGLMAPRLGPAFPLLDTDKSGGISKEEYAAGMAAIGRTGGGR